MADDVVSTIKLEGVSETVKGFEQVGAAAQTAMDTVNKSVTTGNQGLAAFTSNVGAMAGQVGEHFKGIASAAMGVGQSVTRFATNIGRVATRATAFASKMGLGVAALNAFSKAQEGQSAEQKEAAAQTKDANDLMELHARHQDAAAQRTDQHTRSISDLNKAMMRGEITTSEWFKTYTKLQEKWRDDEKDIKRQEEREIAAEKRRQAREKEKRDEDERAAKRIKVQEAYNKVVHDFGGDTASGLMQASTAWESFLAKWNQGPSLLGDIFRGIAQMLNENGQRIIDILGQVGDAFAKLMGVEGGGNRADAFAKAFMKAFEGIANFIINILIPALGGIAKAFEPLAWVINTLFGTKLTGGATAAIAAFIAYAGGIKVIVAAFNLAVAVIPKLIQGIAWIATRLLTLNPIVLAIAAVIAALIINWDGLVAAATGAGRLIVAVWNLVGRTLANVVNAIVGAWNAGIQWIKDSWNAGIQWIKDTWNGAVQWVVDKWNQGIQWIKDTWDSGIQWIKDKWTAVKDFFTWDNIVKMATDAWEAIKKMMSDAWEWMKEAAVNAMKAIADAVVNAIPGLKQLIGFIKEAVNWAKQLFSGGEGDKAKAAAGAKRGGFIRGPGTATSDSVPIWASAGEFMMRTAAVQYYGRSFMAALNSMRLPRGVDLAEALMIPMPRAGFATGGEVTRDAGGRPVILQFPDGQAFALSAANETADRLGRYAMSRRLSSAGRKPSYYGAG